MPVIHVLNSLFNQKKKSIFLRAAMAKSAKKSAPEQRARARRKINHEEKKYVYNAQVTE